jgi:hypothetical protein
MPTSDPWCSSPQLVGDPYERPDALLRDHTANIVARTRQASLECRLAARDPTVILYAADPPDTNRRAGRMLA